MKPISTIFCFLMMTTIALAQQTAVAVKAQPNSKGQNVNIEDLVNRYFDSLNEIDDKRRRELIDQVWAENGKFGTPYREVEGRDAIDALTKAVFEQFPSTRVRRTSRVDGFGKYLRWSFTLSDDISNKPILSGVDFAIVADGKLQLVMGFFDFAPGLDHKPAVGPVRR